MKNRFVKIIQYMRRMLGVVVLKKAEASANANEDRIRMLESNLDESLALLRALEMRSQTIENFFKESLTLLRVSEMRSRTIEYVSRQTLYSAEYQADQSLKSYIEMMPAIINLNGLTTFNASSIIELKTDFPIALESNDHLNPDSTLEGIRRPTAFVQNCISVLGQNIRCLDLGIGAAGLIYEYAMSNIFAVGIDGSDYCRVNRIGYWPLLPNNLFTCDITKPFTFSFRDSKTQVAFDIVTMWEVLEHISESDLPGVLANIRMHLSHHGYFIGSISLLEYNDHKGNKYHVTLKPRDWWRNKFMECGLVVLENHPFNEKFFCRGNGPRFQDMHNYALNQNDGFFFVAQRAFH